MPRWFLSMALGWALTPPSIRLFFTTTIFRISRLISFGFHRFAKAPHPFFATRNGFAGRSAMATQSSMNSCRSGSPLR